MYAFIKGKYEYQENGMAVISAGGIGYLLKVADRTLSQLMVTDSEVTVYTHQTVKEDDISLYGFLSREDKGFFQKLITVKNVGGKIALTILSDPNAEINIASGNVLAVSKIKGIGQKTAERIVLELRGKLKVTSNATRENNGFTTSETMKTTVLHQDVLDVLTSLGITEKDATARIEKYYKDGMQEEQLIALCLRG